FPAEEVPTARVSGAGRAGSAAAPGRSAAAPPPEHPGRHIHDAILAIAHQWGTPDGDPVPLGIVEHTFSHRRERYHCRLVHLVPSNGSRAGRAPGAALPEHAWIGRDAGDRALPRAQQRILVLVHGTAADRTSPGHPL